PVAEVPHHVQQDFVAVRDDQGPAHGASRSRVAASSAGFMSSASAAVTRSGSCAQRKSSTARCVAGLAAEARKVSGVRPVNARKRSARAVSERTQASARRAVSAASLIESLGLLRIVSYPLTG